MRILRTEPTNHSGVLVFWLSMWLGCGFTGLSGMDEYGALLVHGEAALASRVFDSSHALRERCGFALRRRSRRSALSIDSSVLLGTEDLGVNLSARAWWPFSSVHLVKSLALTL